MIKAPFMALIIGLVACGEGLAVQGKRRVARPANDRRGGQIDLSRHRARRHVRDFFCRDRDVSDGRKRQPAMIEARDLVVGFGDQIVLDHLSIEVRRGEILGVVGASGSGKSVLLRTLIGLIPKRAGSIVLDGLDLATASRRNIGVSPPPRHSVPARRVVFLAHGAPKRAIPVTGKSSRSPAACWMKSPMRSSKWLV